jgi:hypothetical protein
MDFRAFHEQRAVVLGIERDGETTELGDTAESEDKKRRDAEKAAED